MNNNNNNRSNSSSNNNGNNNNRRRGRNNSGRSSGGGGNGGGGGAGNPGNRIDSRARGNAPQMLEKYRKLAHDASLNDDRVLTEYYLQFADHYFRVMADMKTQRDEQQSRQGVRRDFERGSDEDGEYGRDDGRDDAPDGGREYARDQARDNDRDGGRDNDREETRNYSADNGDRPRDSSRAVSNDRPNPTDRERAPRRSAPRPQRSNGGENISEGFEGEADNGGNPFSPAPREAREAPREAREAPREPRERKPARRRTEPRNDTPADGLSADMLPPAIARADDAETEAKPVRKPLRVRTKRPVADETGEDAVEVVG